MKKKISFSSNLILLIMAAFFLHGSMILKSNYRQKMGDGLKMEIQAAGLYDCKHKTVEFVEVSTGDVALLKIEGIRLIGDSTVYPVLNRFCLGLNHGDSVYVVNEMALPSVPTLEQLRRKLPPSEIVVNISFGITAVLWIWFVTRVMLWYLQRSKSGKSL